MQESKNVRIGGCLLSMPEGLKELMSDITREVLRAQPQNVYAFIAHYLSALLEVRSSVTIAGQICEDLRHCSCQPELDEELRNIGLMEGDVEIAMRLIETFLANGEEKEESLLMQLLKNTSIDESQMDALQRAVRTAFQRHRLAKCGYYEKPSTPLEPKCIDNVSSISLAGSFINLPKHIPYSVHNDTLSDISEITCDTHTSQYKDEDLKLNKSNTVNTIYKRDVMNKENVIRFNIEMIKYISNEVTEELLEGKVQEFLKDTISVNTDAHSDTSSDD